VSSSTPPSRGIRWTPRAWLLLGTGILLLLVAITARDPVAAFVGLPLLVAPIAATMTGPTPPFRADVAWSADGTGAEVRISGQIRTGAAARGPELHVLVRRPGDLFGPDHPEYRSAPDGADFTFRWTSRWPTVSIVPTPTVVWEDPMGLAQRLSTGARESLVVERSPPDALRMGAVRLDRTLPLPGETRSRRVGPAGEFFGIRDAQPTDPPRRINWLASARAGHPLANEYELDRTADVVILLDARPTQLGAIVDDRILGVSRAAVLAVAEGFLRAKDRVGYAAFGEFLSAVPLAGGRHQRIRIQRAVLGTRRATTVGPSERCAVSLGRYFPRGITVLLVSSLADESTTEIVPHLVRRGHSVVVLSPSPLGVESELVRLDAQDERLAARIERLDRRASIARTWTYAPVVDWDDFWSLAGLVRFLQQPRRRRVV
jgi:uncharacterized protein (DUF58 family)